MTSNELVLIDRALQEAKAQLSEEHRRILDEIKSLDTGHVTPLSTIEGAWGLRLADDGPLPMPKSGWLFNAFSNLRPLAATKIGHWSPDGFVSLGQFSLTRPGTEACLVAQGDDAEKALNAVATAARQYRPEDFDKDGYQK